jgi:hypothetical protein
MKLLRHNLRRISKIVKFGSEARNTIAAGVELTGKLAKISLGPGVDSLGKECGYRV